MFIISNWKFKIDVLVNPSKETRCIFITKIITISKIKSLSNFWRLEKIFENCIDKRRQFNHKYRVSFSASVGVHTQGTFIKLRVFLFTMNEAAEAGHGSYQRISCVIPAIMHVTLSSTCSTCRRSHSSSCCRVIICDPGSSRAWMFMIIRYSILWSQFHFTVENIEKREKNQLLFSWQSCMPMTFR